MTKSLPISFRLPEETKAALERAAKADARSVSSLVTKILTDWLKTNGHLDG
ncbi:Arc family DNA-binding protein [Rubellimicrobium mesophilum]|uniref:Arc family DNA-binding protein n=1 Tax=Rubellimicrobium mesophilum TaxID=1123067 RepID=UPI0009E78167